MSKDEMIGKLCRAIKEYRGLSRGMDDKTGKPIWTHPPQKAARVRVLSWMTRLKVDPEEILFINEFKSHREIEQWVATIK